MRGNGHHPTLILFDIDGTLLAPNGCGRAAFARALQELYGAPGEWKTYSMAGKTDWQILAEQLASLGFTAADVTAALPIFTAAAARHLQAIIHDFAVVALPGALDLIEALRHDPRARLGLVTGNLGATVPIKLGAAGFDPAHFPVGAYGHESADRNDLPPLAARRAGAHWGATFSPERIVIVGDTPADVICARSVGGRAVAVLTGFATRQALAAETPYIILDDLTDRAEVEAALLEKIIMVDEAQKREAAQWLQRGIAALKAKDVKKARQYLLKARELDRTNMDVLLWLTRTTRDPAKRQKILEQALVIDPEHAQALRALQRVQAQLAAQPAEIAAEEMPAAPEPLEPPPSLPELEVMIEEEAPVMKEVAPTLEETLPAPPAGIDLYLPETGELAAPEDEEASEPMPEAADEDVEEPEALAFPETGDLALPDEEELVAPILETPPQPARLATQEMSPPPDIALPSLEVAHLYPDAEWPEAEKARRCLTCGALSIVPRYTSANAPCPLCMQNIFEPAQDGGLLPDTHLPFKVKEAEAAIAIEDTKSGGGLRLFRGRRQMSRPRAVYVPLWLFNGVGRVEYVFSGAEGQGGTHDEPYERVPVHGVPQIDGKLLRLASSIELRNAPRYEARVGQKAFVLLPNIVLQRAMVDVRGLINTDARQRARRAIVSSGRDATGLTITTSTAEELAYQLLLLPVWVNDVREGGRTFMGFVNASTGQALIGDPVEHLRRR